MNLTEARATVSSLIEVVHTDTTTEVRERLVGFLAAVSRGPWWTQLRANPDQPTWGARVVHVLYHPKRGSNPGIFSVQPKPGRGTVPMKVGAGRGDIEHIADKLLSR